MCTQTRNLTLVLYCSQCTYTEINIQLRTRTTNLKKGIHKHCTIIYIQVGEIKYICKERIYKKQKVKLFLHPSTHLSIFAYPVPGHGDSRLSKVFQTSLSPAMFSSYVIPPGSSRSTPGFPPSWMCQENRQGKAPLEAS